MVVNINVNLFSTSKFTFSVCLQLGTFKTCILVNCIVTLPILVEINTTVEEIHYHLIYDISIFMPEWNSFFS